MTRNRRPRPRRLLLLAAGLPLAAGMTLAGAAPLAGALAQGSRTAATRPAHSLISVRSGVVGQRYCEILLLRKESSGLLADVYNTFGLNK